MLSPLFFNENRTPLNKTHGNGLHRIFTPVVLANDQISQSQN